LGHAAPEITRAGPVTITENTGVALASLASRRGREADVAAAAQAAGAGATGGAPGGAQASAPADDNVVDAEVKEVKKG